MVCMVMYACVPFSGVGFGCVSGLVLRRKAIMGVGEVVRLEKRVMRSRSFGWGVLREEGERRRKRNRWCWGEWRFGRARSWV